MLRSLFNSSANILSLTASAIQEASTTTIEIADSKLKNSLSKKSEYEVLVESNGDDKPSTGKDPVIKQLIDLLRKKEFNYLVKTANQAIEDPSSCKNQEAYLRRLDSIEDIIKQAKKTYYSTEIREKLEALHDDIIAKRTELRKGDTLTAISSSHR